MVHVPGGYDKLPQDVPSLALNGNGNIAIQGDRMYVSTAAENVTIDLHDQSVSGIVNQMPTGITATVAQDGMAELLLLPYQYSNATLPVTLTIPTNGVWYTVGAMARNLESRKRSLLNQVAQINLPNATTRILDWWGATLGVERLQGEPDILYAQRIQSLKFEPNVNNIAIENIFEKLGYQTSVVDTAYGEFQVNVNLPTSPPSGFYYTTSQLAETLVIIKAGGVQASIILQGQLKDTVQVSDSISTTLSNQQWTWGNFKWGQFNWYQPPRTTTFFIGGTSTSKGVAQ